MEKTGNNSSFKEAESRSLKDYIILLRNNLLIVATIIGVAFLAALLYAVNTKDIYQSETSIRLSKPQGGILQAPLIPEFQDWGNDRFIANEIEIMKSRNLRSRIAHTLIDTFINSPEPEKFSLILKDQDNGSEKPQLLSLNGIILNLQNKISIEQKRGLDIVTIAAESHSPYEAALIGNIYADEYRNFNLEVNRNQLTFIKNFLKEQRDEKLGELNVAEETLRNYQEKGGIIALDEQATALIAQLSQFEAQRNAARIELLASEEILEQYKQELKKQDPRMADYLESLTSEAYITALQKQIAELQINKDLALANPDSRIDISSKVNDYNKKIAELKEKLNEKINVIKAGIFASSPAQVKELSQKIIEEEVKNRSLAITINGLNGIVSGYDERFNRLPKTALELARFVRQRESLEKLYTLVEEKYQEAIITEQSQPGSVLIIDEALEPSNPAKPNRILIILVGIVLGMGLSFAYVFVKEYFDNTVKTPDDIEKQNINVLAWIPQVESLSLNGQKEHELIVSRRPDSIQSEAFRALRTRVQFSKIDAGGLKTILITSSAPQEGKTFVTINLAGSFAQSGKKTIIVDCDLRKPRVHSVFQVDKTPGLTDYLFGKAGLDSVIRQSGMPNMFYIPSGTIPPNPAEMLDSEQMKSFFKLLADKYDAVLIDSPPIIAVTDSEILSRLVDGTILVVSASSTETELMQRAVDLMKHDNAAFLGTVLNNFSFKTGYGSYYKYYYYYQGGEEKKEKSNK
jgi:capsular exopolysaccharide synthesis family protein